MTTHTAEGMRPSPRPRPDGDGPAGPVRDEVGDPWTDWSWPDAGWSRSTAPDPRGTAPADDTVAHPFARDPEVHDPYGPDDTQATHGLHDTYGRSGGGLDHLDPGRAGWLPLLDDVTDRPHDDRPHDDRPHDDSRDPSRARADGPSRRRRRVVGVLGTLAAVSVGFLGGVVTDRLVAEAPGDGVRLAGEVETDVDGTLAVRGPGGALTAVRTSTGTRVVTANPVAGELPAGTMVDVWTRRAPDGALEATAVAVRP